MTNQDRKYDFSTGQLDYALTLVNKEQDFTISYRGRRFFRWLRRSLYASLILITFNYTRYEITERMSTWGEGPYAAVDKFLMFVMLACVFASLVLFVCCIPYILKIRAMNKQIKKLGLNDLLATPWREVRKNTKILNVIDHVLQFIGYATIAFAFYGIYESTLEVIEGLTDFGSIDFAKNFLVVLFLLVFGLSLYSVPYFRRANSRLKVLQKMQDSLNVYKTNDVMSDEHDNGNTDIAISKDDYDFLANLERAQITRERTQLVAEFEDQGSSAIYALQTSRGFNSELKKLGSQMRSEVETLLEELLRILNAKPSKYQKDDRTKELIHLGPPVITITYKMNHKTKRLQVLSLKRKDDEGKIE